MKDFIAGLDTTLVKEKEDLRTTFRGQRMWAKVGNQPVSPNPLLFFSSAKAAGLSRDLWDLAPQSIAPNHRHIVGATQVLNIQQIGTDSPALENGDYRDDPVQNPNLNAAVRGKDFISVEKDISRGWPCRILRDKTGVACGESFPDEGALILDRQMPVWNHYSMVR